MEGPLIAYLLPVLGLWLIAFSHLIYRKKAFKSSLPLFFKRLFHSFLWPMAVLNAEGRSVFSKLYGG